MWFFSTSRSNEFSNIIDEYEMSLKIEINLEEIAQIFSDTEINLFAHLAYEIERDRAF